MNSPPFTEQEAITDKPMDIEALTEDRDGWMRLAIERSAEIERLQAELTASRRGEQ